MRVRALIASVSLAALLGGCTVSNERLDVGEVLVPEAYEPQPEQPAFTGSEPSITSLSRADWGVMPYVVPVAGTAGNPTYTTDYHWTHDTARQRGQEPTAVSSLDMGGDTRSTRILEAVASGPIALWDMVTIVPRMFWTPPWREVRGPEESYWRAPATTPRRPDLAPPPPDHAP